LSEGKKVDLKEPKQISEYALEREADLESEERKFDETKIEKLINDRDFDYVNNEAPFNLIDWIKNIIKSWLGKRNGSPKNVNLIFNILKWLFVIAAIFFVLSNIFGVEFSKIFTKKHEIQENIFSEILEENIHEINFDESIAKSLQEKNYRYVIRLYYLKTLKNLSDAEIIDWQTFKTNQEYINEIADLKTRTDFNKITLLFSYVWYGQFNIDEFKLQDYIADFETFNNKIKPTFA